MQNIAAFAGKNGISATTMGPQEGQTDAKIQLEPWQ
jgi:hypothetical protein